MDYVPLIAIVLWMSGVVLMMRRPLHRTVPSTELWRLGIVLSAITVACALCGPFLVAQNLGDEPPPDVADLPGRATAEVYQPSGFLVFGHAVDHRGSCEVLSIRFDASDGRRETRVLIAGHALREGDRLPIAYDPTPPPRSEDEAVRALDARPCDRPADSATTGFGVLLLGGVALTLRRVCATEERAHRARTAVTPGA